MDFHEFIAGVKRKDVEIPSVIVLPVGGGWKELVVRTLGERFPDLAANVIRFDDEGLDARRLDVELYALPLFAARKLVIVEIDGAIEDPIADLLNRFAAAPSPATTLLLIAGGSNRSRITAGGTTVVIDRGKEGDSLPPAEVTARFSTQGKTIPPSALQELLRRTGAGGALALRQEIDKLCAYTGKRKGVTLQDVQAVVPEDPEIQNFAMLNAISNGQIPVALEHLHRELRGGKAPLDLLGAVSSSERRLLEARFLFQSGADNDRMARAFRINPQKIGGFLRIVRDQTIDDIRRRLKEILEADARMKSSAEREYPFILEELVIRLCRSRMGRES